MNQHSMGRLKSCIIVWWVHAVCSCTLAFLPAQSNNQRPSFLRTITARSGSSALRASYNPNDFETPEERAARMDLVRSIQAAFYRDEYQTEVPLVDGERQYSASWGTIDDIDPSRLYNLPLWRVQWTEFPGYQTVLNVHVPHYTHMFRKLLAQHQQSSSYDRLLPVYFVHVYLPGGSEQLGNPEYNLPDDPDRISSSLSSSFKDTRTTNNNNSSNKATLVGTLMKITDYMEQPSDGRLTLVVQGVAPIRILAASQQVPYAVASKVEILSDEEPCEAAVQAIAKQLQHRDTTSPENGTEDDLPLPDHHELESTVRYAVQAMMAKQAELLRPLEYLSTTVLSSSAAEEYTNYIVSPLSNVYGSVTLSVSEIAQQCLDTFWASVASASNNEDMTNLLLDNKETLELKDCLFGTMTDLAPLFQQEQDVWIQLDRMLRLLGEAQPGLSIPFPSQLLGLLPTLVDWPDGFRLEEYAEILEQSNTNVGTYSRSPFIWLSKAYPDYPPHRRASRLSYAVWLLLESTVAILGEQEMDRQKLLELRRIGDRLQLAIQQLQIVNDFLQMMLKQVGQ